MIPAITLLSQLNFLAANMNLCGVINEHGIAVLEEKQTQLDELMTLESAAQRWPQLFTAIGLRRAARVGQLQHIHKGRKRFVTERELMEWLHQKEVGASCHVASYLKSAVNGSGKSKAERATTPSDMTTEADRLYAQALRQMISKKPKSD